MNKILNTKFIAVISIVVVGLFVSVAFLQEDKVDAEIFVEQNGVAKAVIIDQLYDEIPNQVFHQKATKYLEEAGYEVDIFTTKDVTIDLYKNLPKMNYEFVIIRSHGATESSDSGSVVLFTGEEYTEDKYTTEQLMGHVKRATPFLELSFKISSNEQSEWIQVNETYKILKTPAKAVENTQREFFAISPKLIDDLMVGKFSGTTFVLGGCDTMSNPSMANALLKRGASFVVGWDNTIGSVDNDLNLIVLLEKILVHKIENAEAVEQTISLLNPERMPYPATLKYSSN